MGRTDRQRVGPLYRPKRVQGPIQVSSSLIGCSDKSESIFLPVIARRNRGASQETGSGKGSESGNSRFLFPAILVPKKNGMLRPVINLSLLNQYIHKQHFKMETVKSVRQSIMYNDWAVSIDLTDAYLHVPIHPISRKYLRFVYDHQVFQFTALPFGMSLSPWVFTKLMNVIAIHLRLCAVSLFPYLDDWLIRDLIRSPFSFLSLLGKISAAADFIVLGRLHLRPLQMCLLLVWKPHILPLDHQVPITRMIKFHLKWWMNSNRFVQGMPIHPPDPEIYLYTDASHFGWGAHLEPMSLSFHGRW